MSPPRGLFVITVATKSPPLGDFCNSSEAPAIINWVARAAHSSSLGVPSSECAGANVMNSSGTSKPTDRTSEFVPLLLEHVQRIHWWIRTAVPRPDQAEEVFQEASLALWEKFSEFQPGTNFTGWAFQIVRFKILEFRKRQARDQRVFSGEFVEDVLNETLQVAGSLETRYRWLADCYAQLAASDRELVNHRYMPGVTSKQLAKKMGRTESFISRALGRIHRLLFECISRHEAEEGGSS